MDDSTKDSKVLIVMFIYAQVNTQSDVISTLSINQNCVSLKKLNNRGLIGCF